MVIGAKLVKGGEAGPDYGNIQIGAVESGIKVNGAKKNLQSLS